MWHLKQEVEYPNRRSVVQITVVHHIVTVIKLLLLLLHGSMLLPALETSEPTLSCGNSQQVLSFLAVLLLLLTSRLLLLRLQMMLLLQVWRQPRLLLLLLRHPTDNMLRLHSVALMAVHGSLSGHVAIKTSPTGRRNSIGGSRSRVVTLGLFTW